MTDEVAFDGMKKPIELIIIDGSSDGYYQDPKEHQGVKEYFGLWEDGTLQEGKLSRQIENRVVFAGNSPFDIRQLLGDSKHWLTVGHEKNLPNLWSAQINPITANKHKWLGRDATKVAWFKPITQEMFLFMPNPTEPTDLVTFISDPDAFQEDADYRKLMYQKNQEENNGLEKIILVERSSKVGFHKPMIKYPIENQAHMQEVLLHAYQRGYFHDFSRLADQDRAEIIDPLRRYSLKRVGPGIVAKTYMSFEAHVYKLAETVNEYVVGKVLYENGFNVPKPHGLFKVDWNFGNGAPDWRIAHIMDEIDANIVESISSVEEINQIMQQSQYKQIEELGIHVRDRGSHNSLLNPKDNKLYHIDFEGWSVPNSLLLKSLQP